jgi:hypothetical protein
MTENLIAYITQPGSVLDWLTIGRVKKLLIICIGLFLVSVESNYAIVFVLKRYKAFPGVNEAGGTDQENNGMGKIIGIIERMILFILIITGNITTIGFVIAAKALARFKELENKNFAEYFLVGTMCSVLITMIIGLFIKKIIG